MSLPAFQNSTRISIYLSTDYEVNTVDLLKRMFKEGKEVSGEFNLSISITKLFSKIFVPTYSGQEMKMLRLYDFDDYEKLPLTKWNIKQPNPDDERRENPMMTGDTAGLVCLYSILTTRHSDYFLDPLDLILVPGVAFTLSGGRMGHGMGYYDKYLHKYFNRFPDRRKIDKTLLVGLGFREQIVDNDQLPLEPFDYPLDIMVTSD